MFRKLHLLLMLLSAGMFVSSPVHAQLGTDHVNFSVVHLSPPDGQIWEYGNPLDTQQVVVKLKGVAINSDWTHTSDWAINFNVDIVDGSGDQVWTDSVDGSLEDLVLQPDSDTWTISHTFTPQLPPGDYTVHYTIVADDMAPNPSPRCGLVQQTFDFHVVDYGSQ